MIVLRTADFADANALAELRAASLVEIGMMRAAAAAAFVPGARREFMLLFGAQRLCAWVACDGERVVGSSCAVFYDRLPYPDGSRHAELCGVYVMPQYRNRGFASELVREVIATTRVKGARKMFLRPSAKARSLYERLGFKATALMTLQEPTRSAGTDATLLGLQAWPAH